jgi:hypothetical protein
MKIKMGEVAKLLRKLMQPLHWGHHSSRFTAQKHLQKAEKGRLLTIAYILLAKV